MNKTLAIEPFSCSSLILLEDLPHRFERGDRDCVGQVQAAGLRPDRDPGRGPGAR
jgi:hypothetical protein